MHPLAQHLAARYDVRESIQGKLLQILAGMPLNVSTTMATISSLKRTYAQTHANSDKYCNNCIIYDTLALQLTHSEILQSKISKTALTHRLISNTNTKRESIDQTDL